MFLTVTSALGNLDAMSYSAPMGENSVARAPEKLEPESRSAGKSAHSFTPIHTGDSIAEHDRVLVHLLRRKLDGRELALPGTALALGPPFPIADAHQSSNSGSVDSASVSGCLLQERRDSLLDMPIRLPRLCGVL